VLLLQLPSLLALHLLPLRLCQILLLTLQVLLLRLILLLTLQVLLLRLILLLTLQVQLLRWILLLTCAPALPVPIRRQLHPLFAADGEDIILHRNFDVLAFEPRQFRRHLDRVVGLHDVDVGNEVVLGEVSQQPAAREVVKQAIDLTVKRSEHRRT
jgi:hypothetical protein